MAWRRQQSVPGVHQWQNKRREGDLKKADSQWHLHRIIGGIKQRQRRHHK